MGGQVGSLEDCSAAVVGDRQRAARGDFASQVPWATEDVYRMPDVLGRPGRDGTSLPEPDASRGSGGGSHGSGTSRGWPHTEVGHSDEGRGIGRFGTVEEEVTGNATGGRSVLGTGLETVLNLGSMVTEDGDPVKLGRTYFQEELGQGPHSHTLSGEREMLRHRFRTGAVYEGQWCRGLRDGFGRQRWPDGTEYVGEWSRGLAAGLGCMTLRDGDLYTGQWVGGRAHGWGTYVFQNGSATYRGQFRCDFRDGVGVESWLDGSCYEGQFRLGKKSGFGENRWPDGTVYSGKWKANHFTGPGSFVAAGGNSYQGQWNESMPHGIGRYDWADGSSFEGRYKNDAKHGFGVLKELGKPPTMGVWVCGQLLR